MVRYVAVALLTTQQSPRAETMKLGADILPTDPAQNIIFYINDAMRYSGRYIK